MLQHQQLLIPGKPQLYRKIISGYNLQPNKHLLVMSVFRVSHVFSSVKAYNWDSGIKMLEEPKAVSGRCGSFLKTRPERHYIGATVKSVLNLTEKSFFS